jgi:hypothetical protein
LVNSISIAARDEGFWGIAGGIHGVKRGGAANMAQERVEKRREWLLFNQTKGGTES